MGYIYIHTHIYIHTYIYIYTYIYTYILLSIQHSHVHPFFLQTAWSTCQVPCVNMQCGPKRVGRGGIASSHSKTSVAAWVRRGSHKGFIKELAWSP